MFTKRNDKRNLLDSETIEENQQELWRAGQSSRNFVTRLSKSRASVRSANDIDESKYMKQNKPYFFSHPNDNLDLLDKKLWRTKSVPFFTYHMSMAEQAKIDSGIEINFWNDLKPEVKNALLCR